MEEEKRAGRMLLTDYGEVDCDEADESNEILSRDGGVGREGIGHVMEAWKDGP